MTAQPLPGLDREALAALRGSLQRAGFTEEAVSARTGVDTIYDFRTLREGRPDDGPPGDALDALIRLFIDGEPLAHTTADGLLEPALIDAASRLQLIGEVDGLLVPRLMLYPTHGLWIASDLEHDPLAPHDAPYTMPEDVVYPAITRSTRTFLSLLPDSACDRFLELCAGTGIAALLAAKHARFAVATDIAERSVVFARFNAALNGLDNVRVAQGDLYDAVSGETFDRIVAHPPYMPALKEGLIYRDGGEDGEQITRRVIAGLPTHLEPGGRFDCTCILTDRVDSPVEARVRAMLGSAHGEFDVVVVVTQTNAPEDAYARLASEGRVGFDDAARHIARFRALRAQRIVGCSVIIVRHDVPRPAVTVRRARSPHTDGAAIDWLLGWMRASTDPALNERLLEMRPRLSPHARLDANYEPTAEGWHPTGFTVRVDSPFAMSAMVPPETASFLAACDGSTTVREHAARLAEGDVDDVTPFAETVRSLALGGFLLMEPAMGDG